jgi:hypothetical protein
VQFLSRSPSLARPSPTCAPPPSSQPMAPLLRGIRSVFCGIQNETIPPLPPSPQQCHHSHRVTLLVLESRRPAIDLSLAESNSRPRAKSAALDRVRDPHPAAEILAANGAPAWLLSSPNRVRAGKKERGGFFLQSFGMLAMHRSCLVVLLHVRPTALVWGRFFAGPACLVCNGGEECLLPFCPLCHSPLPEIPGVHKGGPGPATS